MKLKFLIMAVLLIAGLAMSLFSTDRLTRFCLYTPIKTFLISIVLAVILWAFSGLIFEGENIETYFQVKGKDLLLFPLFLCFACSISSYSIFLCEVKRIRQNNILIFVSFLIIPLISAKIILLSQSNAYPLQQTLYYSIAYIIPQLYFYMFFIKETRNGRWTNK